jgi:preprotein translocase subunit SecE
MATQEATTTSGNALDAVKWIAALLLLVGATLGNQYLTSVPAVARIGGVVVLAIVALGVVLTTSKGHRFIEAMKESRVELRKIVWPTRQETWQTTLIVVAVVLVTALLLWGVDSLFGWIISAIIKLG